MVSARKRHLKGRKNMPPSVWQLSVALSEQAEHIVERICAAILFMFFVATPA
jgi:hypothetical protein